MGREVLLSSLDDGKHVLRASCTRGGCWHFWQIEIGQVIQTLGDMTLAELRGRLRCEKCNAPVTTTLTRLGPP
jgi:hypothetical protein